MNERILRTTLRPASARPNGSGVPKKRHEPTTRQLLSQIVLQLHDLDEAVEALASDLLELRIELTSRNDE